MEIEKSKYTIMDAHINEFNELKDKLHQNQEEIKKANKERKEAITQIKKANKERDDALSKINHFIEALQKFKKEGKLSDEDLASVGIFL